MREVRHIIHAQMTISRNRLRLEMEGHAGYAEEGRDIVCAAASSLVSTLMLALSAQLGGGSDIYFDDPRAGPMVLDCGPQEDDMESARLIYRTIACGLEALAYRYPDNVEFQLTEDI